MTLKLNLCQNKLTNLLTLDEINALKRMGVMRRSVTNAGQFVITWPDAVAGPEGLWDKVKQLPQCRAIS